MPPAAPSFPPCRKRWGRKGALDYVWCILRVQFMQAPALYSLRAHILTLRALWYAPPVTVHRICKQLRFNICGENALRLKFARQYRFAAVPSKPPLAASRAVRGGFWLIVGLVPARPRLPGEPSISGSTGKKEETALEDKRLREQRGLVPARPFPTIRRRRSSGTLCRSSDRAAGCQRRSPQSPDSPRSVPHRPSRR